MFLYIFFSACLYLCIFLHSYLVCANNLIGANVLRFIGKIDYCSNDYVLCVSYLSSPFRLRSLVSHDHDPYAIKVVYDYTRITSYRRWLV
jgi:hypothetical protein